MKLNLVPSDDPILTTKLEPFDFENPPVDPTQLAKDLVETMFEHGGLGLSANQVGVPYRVFAMRAETPFVCFNPRVVFRSEKLTDLDEACLSFPGLVYKVKRPESIRVRFNTPNGNISTQTFKGLSARVFEHEMMHMDGLFPFEGIGRMRLEKAMKIADRAGKNYHVMGLMKRA